MKINHLRIDRRQSCGKTIYMLLADITDSDRFGKNEILIESANIDDIKNYMKKNKLKYRKRKPIIKNFDIETCYGKNQILDEYEARCEGVYDEVTYNLTVKIYSYNEQDMYDINYYIDHSNATKFGTCLEACQDEPENGMWEFWAIVYDIQLNDVPKLEEELKKILF